LSTTNNQDDASTLSGNDSVDGKTTHLDMDCDSFSFPALNFEEEGEELPNLVASW
jgi:hypothetical protein